MFVLGKKIKKNIEKTTGLPVSSISKMSSEKINAHIEKKIGKKLRLSVPKDKRLIGRGSVYIALRRLLSSKKINRKIARI
ncbi:MAG: hypothetical protein HQ580_04900 [Planctomycetes bacterium]|nr:hypothetical protein [Planctomycetota bacterium]